MTRAALVLATMCSLSFELPASGWQEQSAASSREQVIQTERDAKAATLVPEALPPTESAVKRIQDQRIVERILSGSHGWRVKLGGMGTGGGFALGPEYSSEAIAGGYITAKASAQISTRAWQKYRAEVLLPHLAGGRMAAGLTSEYRNYNSLDYYGPGPNSALTGRTNYRMEDTLVQGSVAVQPVKYLRAGGTGFREPRRRRLRPRGLRRQRLRQKNDPKIGS